MKSCNGCGRCCDSVGGGGLSASPADIEYWETHRPDIARYASGRRIWVDPDSGEYLSVCPFLVRADRPGVPATSCAIYEDRPEECRHYPVEVEQMVLHDCEMLEPIDRKDWKRAQRQLDAIMSDHRPPVGPR